MKSNKFPFFFLVGLLTLCFFLVSCDDEGSSSSSAPETSSSEDDAETSSTSSTKTTFNTPVTKVQSGNGNSDQVADAGNPLNGTYRISLNPTTSNSELEGSSVVQSATLEVTDGVGFLEMKEPKPFNFQQAADIDDSGNVTGEVITSLDGSQTMVFQFLSTQIDGNLIEGSYNIHIAGTSFAEGTLTGIRQDASSATVDTGSQGSAGREQNVSAYNGQYFVSLERDDGSSTKMCFVFTDGNLSAESDDGSLEIEGAVNLNGDVLMIPAEGASSNFSGTGDIDASRTIGGDFTINGIDGDFTGSLDLNCPNTLAAHLASLSSGGSSSSSSSNASSNTNTTTNSDDDFVLCSIRKFQDDTLVCRSVQEGGCQSGFPDFESQLNSDGNEGTDLEFSDYASCYNKCEGMAGEENPNSGLGFLGLDKEDFGLCESAPPADDSDPDQAEETPDSELTGFILCADGDVGDSKLSCHAASDGCRNRGLLSDRIVDAAGSGDDTHSFTTMNSCNAACSNLENTERPDATELQKFTGIGDDFGSCRTDTDNKEHVLCARVSVDSDSSDDELFCALEREGCLSPSERISSTMQVLLAQGSAIFQINGAGEREDDTAFTFSTKSACTQTCTDLANSAIPNSTLDSINFSIFSNSLDDGKDYGICTL